MSNKSEFRPEEKEAEADTIVFEASPHSSEQEKKEAKEEERERLAWKLAGSYKAIHCARVLYETNFEERVMKIDEESAQTLSDRLDNFFGTPDQIESINALLGLPMVEDDGVKENEAHLHFGVRRILRTYEQNVEGLD